ncbi:hypothetical protein HDV06_007164 [Boothiomyces sp. JEL0866]|nr:hypothetical protein HDV06_007164 [Boothiomyces sp. JEL0866]
MISVGIVGAGLSAQVFHAPFILNDCKFRLVSFLRTANKPVPGFEDIPVRTDLEDFTKDIDLVVITSPSHLHYPHVLEYLKLKKHVVVEKPMSTTYQQALELISIAKENKLVLACYQNRVFDGDFMTVQQLISENQLGRIVEFESNFDRFRTFMKTNAWRELDLEASGILYDLGPHLIHQVLVLFGIPLSVQAIVDNTRRLQETSTVDYFSIVLRYKDLIVRLGARMVARINSPRFVIHGMNGSFSIQGTDPQEPQLKSGIKLSDSCFGVSKDRNALLVNDSANGEIEIKNDFKSRIPNIIKSLSNYELVFIDGPIPMEYKGPAEHAPSGPTYNGWFPLVDGRFDLNDPAGINRIKEYWNDEFVGIITFSYGSVVAGLAYNILKPEFMICINGFARAFENNTGRILKISGYRDKAYPAVVQSSGEGISFDGSHAYNETEFANIAKLADKIAYWLHPEEVYDYKVLKYTLTLTKNTKITGKLIINLVNNVESNKIILDCNENISVEKAVIQHETMEIPAKNTNGSKLVLEFKEIPAQTNIEIHLEYTVNGDISFPCLKYQKAPILLTTFAIKERFVFFGTFESSTAVIDGDEYLVQQYKETSPMAPSTFNAFTAPTQ